VLFLVFILLSDNPQPKVALLGKDEVLDYRLCNLHALFQLIVVNVLFCLSYSNP
jgi:hypothetical protein